MYFLRDMGLNMGGTDMAAGNKIRQTMSMPSNDTFKILRYRKRCRQLGVDGFDEI